VATAPAVKRRGCARTAMARVERPCPPANRQSCRRGAKPARGPAPARATPRGLHRAGTFVLLAGRTRAKRLGIAPSASESREPLPALPGKRFADARARSSEGTALRGRGSLPEVGGARSSNGAALRNRPSPFGRCRRASVSSEPVRSMARRSGIDRAGSEPDEPARRNAGSALESVEPVQDRTNRSGIGSTRSGSRDPPGNRPSPFRIARGTWKPTEALENRASPFRNGCTDSGIVVLEHELPNRKRPGPSRDPERLVTPALSA